ncbi:MAG: (2Fe-2S)-binding protein, partial [Lautropia sp.]
IAGIERGTLVRFSFESVEIEAYAGESVATALLAAGIRSWRNAPRDGGPRGLLCAMGSCQECVVRIDDIIVEACRAEVRSGLAVRRVS